MASISEEDLRVIRSLRTAGVLDDVEPHLLNQQNGAVVVVCADGDQSYDIFTNHARMQDAHRSDPRIHYITRNGGALRLAPYSPANKHGRTTQLDLLDEIAETLPMKGIETVALYIHAPCGKAATSAISFALSIELLFEAKRILKANVPGVRVSCFSHVDYGPNFIELGKTKQRLTYFASRTKWEEYKRSTRSPMTTT